MLGKILFELSEAMYENRENWQVRIKMKEIERMEICTKGKKYSPETVFKA